VSEGCAAEEMRREETQGCLNAYLGNAVALMKSGFFGSKSGVEDMAFVAVDSNVGDVTQGQTPREIWCVAPTNTPRNPPPRGGRTTGGQDWSSLAGNVIKRVKCLVWFGLVWFGGVFLSKRSVQGMPQQVLEERHP
jgi:hypothetical protein